MQDNQQKHIDIQDAWKKMTEQKFSKRSLNKQEIMNAILLESNSSIGKLKRNLKRRLFIMLLGLPLSAVVLIVPNLLGFFLFMVTLQLLIMIPLVLAYLKMDNNLDASSNILNTMKYNLSMIKSTLNYERLSLLLMIPCLILIGWILIQLGYGDFILEYINRPNSYKLALMFLVFLPLAIIHLEYTFKRLYGTHIKTLESNIIRLETQIDS